MKRPGLAHSRSCMNSRKVDCEHSTCKAFKGPFHPFGFTHQPHEHVILYLCIMITLTLSEVDQANRLVIPIFPKLHSRKTFLDHRSDEFHFLSDLRWKVR